MATKTEDTPKFTDLLDLDEDALTEASPAPEDDPLSLVRDAEEKESPSILNEDGVTELKDGEKVVFHVVADEIYILNRQYYKGDNIEITVGRGMYPRTLEQDGRSWLRHIDNEDEQIRRWRKRVFAPGKSEDARLDLIPVPDFIVDDEQVRVWREAVLDAAEKFNRTR